MGDTEFKLNCLLSTIESAHTGITKRGIILALGRQVYIRPNLLDSYLHELERQGKIYRQKDPNHFNRIIWFQGKA